MLLLIKCFYYKILLYKIPLSVSFDLFKKIQEFIFLLFQTDTIIRLFCICVTDCYKDFTMGMYMY